MSVGSPVQHVRGGPARAGLAAARALLAAAAAGAALTGPALSGTADAAEVTAVAEEIPAGETRQLVDPAPAATARGLPLERLPREVPALDTTDTTDTTGPSPTGPALRLPGSRAWPAAAAGALGLLVLRRRRRTSDPGAGGAREIATGTPALVRVLTAALARAEPGEPVGLVLLRVDLRRGPGPSAGGEEGAGAVLAALDAAVTLVARRAGGSSRPGDALVRLGVNRLAVVLPATGEDAAWRAGERIRAAVAGVAGPRVTVGLGCAASPADGDVPSVVLRAAERALRADGARVHL